MLKRLIEVAFPLKEVSEQSGAEKRQISALHLWWARRPLPTCRAVILASLIPDPDDPECPEEFRKLVNKVLSRGEFMPKNGDGTTVEDTPRNRCLEFIKHLLKWENSNNPDYIEPAHKLIVAAHKFLHPDAVSDAPKVLDPFAGGGAIPLEALRLGCEAHAIDLNPVAHLIELCTLVYPQKYGQPDGRPVPDYVQRLIAYNRAKRKAKVEADLFDKDDAATATNEGIIPDVEISETEYRKNPLAADVRYWGHLVLEKTRWEIGHAYDTEHDTDNNTVPIAFLWSRTVACPNPQCRSTIPLIRQFWLAKTSRKKVAIRLIPNPETKRCDFVIASGNDIDFDLSVGTMQQGRAEC